MNILNRSTKQPQDIEYGRKSFRYNGRWVHSERNPEAEAGKIIDKMGNPGSLIIVGSGMGYLSKSAQAKKVPVWALNPPEWDNLDEDATITKENYSWKKPPFSMENAKIYIPPIVQRLLPQWAEDTGKEIGRLIARAKASQTVNAIDHCHINNMIRNTGPPLIKHRLLAPFKGPFIPSCFIAGGGFGLKQSVHYLQSHWKGVPVIAILQSLPYLLHNQIKPWAVCLGDPSPHNQRYIQRIAQHKLASTIPLIASLTAHPSAIKQWPGPLYWVSTGLEIEKLLGHKELMHLPLEGTVLTMALALGLRVAKNVYICGADFSWVDGHTHAPGSETETSRPLNGTRLSPLHSHASRAAYPHSWRRLIGYDRTKKYPSNTALSLYAGWFDDLGQPPRIFQLETDPVPLGKLKRSAIAFQNEAKPLKKPYENPFEGTTQDEYFQEQHLLCTLDAVKKIKQEIEKQSPWWQNLEENTKKNILKRINKSL